jgi:hypothetical protein
MQTYRPIQVDSGRWAVERLVEGRSHGFALGTCTNEAEARLMAHEFARRKAPRPVAAHRQDPQIRAREPLGTVKARQSSSSVGAG